jgi:hypothetical protein
LDSSGLHPLVSKIGFLEMQKVSVFGENEGVKTMKPQPTSHGDQNECNRQSI